MCVGGTVAGQNVNQTSWCGHQELQEEEPGSKGCERQGVAHK